MKTKTNNDIGALFTARLFDRVFNVPLMVDQDAADMVIGVLTGKFPMVLVDAESDEIVGAELIAKGEYKEIPSVNGSRYFVRSDGTAIVPVQGKLVHRHSGVHASSGLQPYKGVVSMMEAAMQDEDVKQIYANFDTPGGEVSGAFEAAERIYKMRGQKPMVALVNEQATSAGFLLASSMDMIAVNSSSIVGSVGVIANILDTSKRDEGDGVKRHVVSAGFGKDRFAKGVSEKDLAWLKEKVDASYTQFVEAVSKYRPQISEDDLRNKFGAEIYVGQQAVDNGFADFLGDVSTLLDKPEKDVYSISNAKNSHGATPLKAAEPSRKPQEAEKAMPTKLEKAVFEALGLEASDDEKTNIEETASRILDLQEGFNSHKQTMELIGEAGFESVEKLLEANAAAVDAKLEAEAAVFVGGLLAEGILPEAKREWAVKKFVANAEDFKSLVEGMPKSVPVGEASNVVPHKPAPPVKSESEMKTDAELAELRKGYAELGYSEKQIDATIEALKAETE